MNDKNGFTIVEMLGVVTILVIISLFTFPLIASLMTDSSNSKYEQFLESLYNAAEVYVEINYDKYKNQEIGYINARRLVEEGFLQTDFINPATKNKLTVEDGIVEVSRDIDNSFKFNYVINQYITINYIEDLIEILNSSSDYQNKIIVLGRDLDINDDSSYENVNTSYNDTTIKNALTNGDLIPKTTDFKGQISGNGYEISNIKIDSDNDNIGLFSSLTDATIENIKLSGQISGRNNVGLLSGSATNVTIDNVSVDAKFSYNSSLVSNSVGGVIGSGSNVQIKNVSSNTDFTINGTDIGGIVGKLTSNSTISNSEQTGFMSGTENVGGIVGNSSNITTNSLVSKGNILGDNNIGGIVGNSTSDTIEFSNTSASISGSSNIGGIVGSSSNTISNKNYSAGNVSGVNNIGGIIGYAQGNSNISRSNSTAKIFGSENVGGLVGNLSASTVSNCYNFSNLSADKQVGGLVGTSSSATIENSYYSGNILSTIITNIGGLVGLSSSSNLQNCYYNADLVTYDAVGSSTNDTKTDFIGKTDDEMLVEDTYQNWDFTTVWKIDSGSYPSLR